MWKEVLSPPALSTRVPPRTVIAAGVAASFLLIGAGVMGLNHSVLKFGGWPAGERAHRVVTQVVRPPLQYRQDHPGEALRALERGRAAVPGLPAARPKSLLRAPAVRARSDRDPGRAEAKSLRGALERRAAHRQPSPSRALASGPALTAPSRPRHASP